MLPTIASTGRYCTLLSSASPDRIPQSYTAETKGAGHHLVPEAEEVWKAAQLNPGPLMQFQQVPDRFGRAQRDYGGPRHVRVRNRRTELRKVTRIEAVGEKLRIQHPRQPPVFDYMDPFSATRTDNASLVIGRRLTGHPRHGSRAVPRKPVIRRTLRAYSPHQGVTLLCGGSDMWLENFNTGILTEMEDLPWGRTHGQSLSRVSAHKVDSNFLSHL